LLVVPGCGDGVRDLGACASKCDGACVGGTCRCLCQKCDGACAGWTFGCLCTLVAAATFRGRACALLWPFLRARFMCFYTLLGGAPCGLDGWVLVHPCCCCSIWRLGMCTSVVFFGGRICVLLHTSWRCPLWAGLSGACAPLLLLRRLEAGRVHFCAPRRAFQVAPCGPDFCVSCAFLRTCASVGVFTVACGFLCTR
jgi:hypothetical protein